MQSMFSYIAINNTFGTTNLVKIKLPLKLQDYICDVGCLFFLNKSMIRDDFFWSADWGGCMEDALGMEVVDDGCQSDRKTTSLPKR